MSFWTKYTLIYNHRYRELEFQSSMNFKTGYSRWNSKLNRRGERTPRSSRGLRRRLRRCDLSQSRSPSSAVRWNSPKLPYWMSFLTWSGTTWSSGTMWLPLYRTSPPSSPPISAGCVNRCNGSKKSLPSSMWRFSTIWAKYRMKKKKYKTLNSTQSSSPKNINSIPRDSKNWMARLWLLASRSLWRRSCRTWSSLCKIRSIPWIATFRLTNRYTYKGR